MWTRARRVAKDRALLAHRREHPSTAFIPVSFLPTPSLFSLPTCLHELVYDSSRARGIPALSLRSHWEEGTRLQMRPLPLQRASFGDYGTVLWVSRLCISGKTLLPYEYSITNDSSRAPVMKVRLRKCFVVPMEPRN